MAKALPSAAPWRCPPMGRAVAAALRPCPRVPPRKMAAAVRGAEELELLERLLGLPGGNKYGVQGERKVPVLQSNSGPGLTGLMTIAAHLVRQARKDQLLGSTAEEKAVVQQWLEYRVTRVNGGSSKEDTRTILKDLNMHLEDKVYLAGNIFTLADILMYYGLHRIMVDLTVQEKEKYLNVSRWFNHIQHYPGVRQHLSDVVFIKNRLYTNAH
ncbi:eukaryotic translation elongation factor 1 epsilon-1 [Taeniopygia guttata]|uniref:eukaryotic translation elongation factor 1 epsilon-1 n=1 Tax=Taeniopygia guttata TaxID=59729 RepID=UPI003BB969AD